MRQNYYVLGPTYKPKWYWGKVLNQIDCHMLAVKGMRDYTETVKLEIVDGKQEGDFIWNGFTFLIVSEKVLDIWKSYEAFKTFNVEFINISLSSDYRGVAFTGRGGPFDPVQSKTRYIDCSEPGIKPAIMRHEGLYFNDNFWDGSDLLTVDDFPCIPVVTERMMIEMKRHKITNCIYEPIEEYGKIKVPKIK